MTYADILKRLREATEGSHTLDEELAVALGLVPTGPEWKKTAVGTWHKNLRWDQSGARYDACFQPGRYTDSLDAAIALVEMMLPGWFWDVSLGCMCDEGGPYWSELYNTDIREPNYNGFWSGSRDPIEHCAPTPALALLIALLEALSDKGEPKP